MDANLQFKGEFNLMSNPCASWEGCGILLNFLKIIEWLVGIESKKFVRQVNCQKEVFYWILSRVLKTNQSSLS